eukprot:1381690-Rhodomonas_salina.3
MLPMVLRGSYGMSGTAIGCAMVLSEGMPYGMSGTKLGYAGTQAIRSVRYSDRVNGYQFVVLCEGMRVLRPTECPVLRQGRRMPVSGTERGYTGTSERY